MNRSVTQPGAAQTAPRPDRGGRSFVPVAVWLVIFLLLLSACGAPGAANLNSTATQSSAAVVTSSTLGPDAKDTRTPFPTRKPPAGTHTATLDPSAQPTEGATAAAGTPVAGDVTLTFGSALNIRRGPGLTYDTVAAFQVGQTAQANGRDSKGEWLQVEVPNSPGVFGWVYSKATTVSVAGDPLSLPEATFGEAVPAYVRNCTTHQLSLRPGELILEPLAKQPANRIQVNPGFYEVVDLTLNAKSVMTMSVTEGSELVLTKDGNGVNYTCPR